MTKSSPITPGDKIKRPRLNDAINAGLFRRRKKKRTEERKIARKKSHVRRIRALRGGKKGEFRHIIIQFYLPYYALVKSLGEKSFFIHRARVLLRCSVFAVDDALTLRNVKVESDSRRPCESFKALLLKNLIILSLLCSARYSCFFYL